MGNNAIGVDIGGTKIQVALVNQEKGIMDKIIIPTLPETGGEDISFRISKTIKEILEKHQTQAIGIGIGTAGQISNDGIIKSATDVFSNWVNFPLKTTLESLTGLHTQVINDVQAMALGEYRYGLKYENMISLAMGTGVGGAIISEGTLIRGEKGAAGELGHLLLKPSGRRCPCGNFGCVEAYLSGPALEREYKSITNEFKSAQAIFSSTDSLAQALVNDFLQDLITTCTTLTNIFSPEAIILSGGVANSLSPYIDFIEENVQRRVLKINKDIKIKQSELLADAMILGAASLCF